jgi:hypothetical protein
MRDSTQAAIFLSSFRAGIKMDTLGYLDGGEWRLDFLVRIAFESIKLKITTWKTIR